MNFPHEIMVNIFSFLSADDVINSSKVCRSLRLSALSDDVWKDRSLRYGKPYPGMSYYQMYMLYGRKFYAVTYIPLNLQELGTTNDEKISLGLFTTIEGAKARIIEHMRLNIIISDKQLYALFIKHGHDFKKGDVCRALSYNHDNPKCDAIYKAYDEIVPKILDEIETRSEFGYRYLFKQYWPSFRYRLHYLIDRVKMCESY